jgi:dihydroorotate dehydrogenase electron transfer subunit
LIITKSVLVDNFELENSIHLIKIYSPEIAKNSSAGQFCNIKVCDSNYPLLRRPFSICDVEGEYIYFIFSIYGEGTRLLAHKKVGDLIDILGPLGNGFNPYDNYDTAVIVAGGLGAAPFPFLTKILPKNRKLYTFIGGRTSKDVITYGMNNIITSTDDGSLGFKGNVVELLQENKNILDTNKIKIFACGPNAMLRALKKFCEINNYNCEASTECAMACGFGICQGCPIEAADKDGYYLVCKDGPVFDIRKVIL